MTAAGSDARERQRGFKPREVDEPIDTYLHRPLASVAVRLLLPLPITPNQVTVLSACIGLLSGICISMAIWRSVWWVAGAAGILLLSVILDCADGQLARIRGQSSPVGRILDGVMDVVAVASVFFGFGFFLLSRGYSIVFAWPVGLAAACSLVLHTSQYDGVKNLYLHCSRPDFSLGGKTLLSVADIERFKREFTAQGAWFNVFLMKVWMGWTRSQNKTFAAWHGELSPRSDEERELYRGLFRGYMRAWSWLGLGFHHFMLMLACLATPLYEDAIWIVWATMLGPMNLLHGFLVWRRGHLERTFAKQLEQLRSSPASGPSEPVAA